MLLPPSTASCRCHDIPRSFKHAVSYQPAIGSFLNRSVPHVRGFVHHTPIRNTLDNSAYIYDVQEKGIRRLYLIQTYVIGKEHILIEVTSRYCFFFQPCNEINVASRLCIDRSGVVIAARGMRRCTANADARSSFRRGSLLS